ncbi:nitrate reductase molybdenum cofactor assembly chaperone [Methylotenera sp.]|uniref:nitrate reductase molybdenum cofactor assembly chaperone n=1 Tax=Methylotenera sp. TaxID=2051956 RepID=UPI0027287F89|nr:nitrate reductase molybdenum cofactor assembly chaperone [Methylotenera sp.]MDO9205765.1 nitrate reductase molybdenum cofactor assembly chaperone [Methylotenera sp.]MDO9394068.1 nitrate reductase molybdenum cofactor assembly chaperone [Methylotenera sp.]MDP2071409.1 nitrate reductase molybdenum cofactor assembly chaperone [Methylotenera sp.]MDP2230431.1 nitrate reductase molybdenum cofactor assembly chaperone [Methylotenera sp.]MDP3005370.1 nitrate reductase molybdenum cofactor assembly cha
MQIYKLLSALLDYPNQELLEHLPELQNFVVQNQEIDHAEREALQSFLSHLQSMSVTELQADYVQTFDMTAEHSLHLTHHLFGDDKNRGPALIDLGELYKDYGVEVVTNELPDYLPLVLEFAAYMDDNEATVFLSDAKKVLGVLTENLQKAESPYATLLSIIENRATLTKLAA